MADHQGSEPPGGAETPTEQESFMAMSSRYLQRLEREAQLWHKFLYLIEKALCNFIMLYVRQPRFSGL